MKKSKGAPAPAAEDPAQRLAFAIGRPLIGVEVFDRIADMVFFIKDREARYVAVNETLAARCGLTGKQALIGRKASDIFPPLLGDRYEAQDLKVLAEGISIRGRLELHLYADRREGWCLTWKEPLVDARGEVQGLIGLSRDAPALLRQGRAPEELSATLAYVDEHLDLPLRVPALAARAGLSSFQFDQRVRALFGLSAGQYLSRLRIGRACDLLRRTNAPLSELALDCGYADQAAFTRQFHKSVGMAPGAYRLATARRGARAGRLVLSLCPFSFIPRLTREG